MASSTAERPGGEAADTPAAQPAGTYEGRDGWEVAKELGPLIPPTSTPEPDITVVVPSAWRPGKVLVDQMLPPEEFVVLVAEDQVADYRAAQPHLRYDVFPGTEHPSKWDWALEKYGSVMWVDDDFDRMYHFEHAAGDGICRLTPQETIDLFRRTAWEAAQVGAYLFCYGDNLKNYNDLHPFRLTGFVPGGVFGMLAGSGLWWHEDCGTAGDYWLSALNAYMHRVIWVDGRYGPAGPKQLTFKNPGGAARLRTIEGEKRDYLLLKRYFGDAIQPKQPTVRAKLTHEYQRRLVVPF